MSMPVKFILVGLGVLVTFGLIVQAFTTMTTLLNDLRQGDMTSIGLDMVYLGFQMLGVGIFGLLTLALITTVK